MTTAQYEPRDESIEQAVARETARRRRVFIAFLALLLVPIAIGGYALAKAPTETTLVADRVTPVVTNRVGGIIDANISKEVATRVVPLVRENVASEFSSTVAPRIASVANDAAQLRQNVEGVGRQVQTLQTTVQSNADFIAAAAPKLEETAGTVAKFSNEQTEIRKQLEEQRAMANRLSQQPAQLDAKLSAERERTQQQYADLAKNLSVINQRLDRLTESTQTANRSVGLIEGRLEKLERRVGALEATIQKQRIQPPRIQ